MASSSFDKASILLRTGKVFPVRKNARCFSTISTISCFKGCYNVPSNYNVFATEKQAKSALAMARISQIMANDERFGGSITDEEWDNGTIKYCIMRHYNYIITVGNSQIEYYFLAFHTPKQRDLFLKENEDLVRDYLMID